MTTSDSNLDRDLRQDLNSKLLLLAEICNLKKVSISYDDQAYEITINVEKKEKRSNEQRSKE